MSVPPAAAYPLPIGVGDAEHLTREGWVAVLRAAPATWAGTAAESYLLLRQEDLDAARLAVDRVAEAVTALRHLHASRTTAFLALQGLAPPGLVLAPSVAPPAAGQVPATALATSAPPGGPRVRTRT